MMVTDVTIKILKKIGSQAYHCIWIFFIDLIFLILIPITLCIGFVSFLKGEILGEF